MLAVWGDEGGVGVVGWGEEEADDGETVSCAGGHEGCALGWVFGFDEAVPTGYYLDVLLVCGGGRRVCVRRGVYLCAPCVDVGAGFEEESYGVDSAIVGDDGAVEGCAAFGVFLVHEVWV